MSDAELAARWARTFGPTRRAERFADVVGPDLTHDESTLTMLIAPSRSEAHPPAPMAACEADEAYRGWLCLEYGMRCIGASCPNESAHLFAPRRHLSKRGEV